jgi:hypothetical protein
MAALPPSNTARYKVVYFANGHQHSVIVRASGAHSPSGFGTWFDGLMTILDPIWSELSINRVDFAASGSDIFNPVTSGIEGNVYGSGTPAGLLHPQFLAFQGRTSGGHKTRLSLYGVGVEENDYRFNTGDVAEVDAAVTYMQTTSPYAKGIDGITPTWYSYANTGFNAYWQRKERT